MIVNLDIDRYTGQPRREPEFITRGFIASQEGGELLTSLRRKVMDTALHANGHMQRDVEQAVSNFLFSETRRRPMVLVNILKS
jgi:mRNA degradation ribonuclease J1/J2